MPPPVVRGLATDAAKPRDGPSPLRCTGSSVDGGAVVLRLAGEVDLSSAGLLEGWLAAAQAGGAEVALDLGDVAFFDSAGVKALLHAAARSSVRVTRAPAAVRRTMAITGLDKVVIVDDPEPGAR